jgi:hypothetical protein
MVVPSGSIISMPFLMATWVFMEKSTGTRIFLKIAGITLLFTNLAFDS